MEKPILHADAFNRNLPTVSAWSALAAFGLFVVVAMARNGWVFEYPLDDVYIHLAMATQIADGGYGVNAGEFASAASSPLYPIFLTPFADTESQRWWPLLWNIVALILAARLLGKALEKADLGQFGLLLVIAAPAALAMYATAYAGMENMAHTVASLAIVLGLWHFAETGRIGFLIVAGVVLAPAFRLEGLALTTAAGATVLLFGRPLAGLVLIVLGIVPVAVFAWFLTSLGLDPLPNSVMAKLADQSGASADGRLARIVGTFSGNAQSYGGRFLLVLAIVTTLVALAVLKTDRRKAYVGLAVAASGFAHLAFGATGWLDRYETYANVAVFSVLAMLLPTLASRAVRASVLAVAVVGGFSTYGPYIPNNMENMGAIHRQQSQMARFVKDFAPGPVAVNDIGYVAWHNPDYVLDLWGLASKVALEHRLTGDTTKWADKLADQSGVRLAMIYDDWLGETLGPDWVRLGTLWVEAPGAFLGGADVAFFARNAADVPILSDALEEWAAGLPEGSEFRFSGGAQG